MSFLKIKKTRPGDKPDLKERNERGSKGGH